MYLIDLTALDKLIDFHNENTIVIYKNNKYTLYDLKEYFIDSNVSFPLEKCTVSSQGIEINNNLIISVVDLRRNQKDDLMDL